MKLQKQIDIEARLLACRVDEGERDTMGHYGTLPRHVFARSLSSPLGPLGPLGPSSHLRFLQGSPSGGVQPLLREGLGDGSCGCHMFCHELNKTESRLNKIIMKFK